MIKSQSLHFKTEKAFKIPEIMFGRAITGF